MTRFGLRALQPVDRFTRAFGDEMTRTLFAAIADGAREGGLAL